LLLVIEGVEAFVLDDGTTGQAFAEVRIPDGARLIEDQRGGHKPHSTPDRQRDGPLTNRMKSRHLEP
jgi:hypothetical protein